MEREQSLTGCGRSHRTGRHGGDLTPGSVAMTGEGRGQGGRCGRGQGGRCGSLDSCAVETTPYKDEVSTCTCKDKMKIASNYYD